jgi:hypothetical protein
MMRKLTRKRWNGHVLREVSGILTSEYDSIRMAISSSLVVSKIQGGPVPAGKGGRHLLAVAITM